MSEIRVYLSRADYLRTLSEMTINSHCAEMADIGQYIVDTEARHYAGNFHNGNYQAEYRASDAGLAFDIEDALADLSDWTEQIF